jgi:hypothetical protein
MTTLGMRLVGSSRLSVFAIRLLARAKPRPSFRRGCGRTRLRIERLGVGAERSRVVTVDAAEPESIAR